jgi:hypothetical protein
MLFLMLTIPSIYVCYKLTFLVKEKYYRFKELNSIVSINQKNKIKSLYISILMIFEMFRVSFIQYLIKSIECRDKKNIILSYSLKGHLYKMILVPKKGPSSISIITDENNIDVTNEILPFLGPQEDWHNHIFTPKYWNKKSLRFQINKLDNLDNCLIFTQDQIIDLNLKN